GRPGIQRCPIGLPPNGLGNSGHDSAAPELRGWAKRRASRDLERDAPRRTFGVRAVLEPPPSGAPDQTHDDPEAGVGRIDAPTPLDDNTDRLTDPHIAAGADPDGNPLVRGEVTDHGHYQPTGPPPGGPAPMARELRFDEAPKHRSAIGSPR